MIPGGGGSEHNACNTWRAMSRIARPRNGRSTPAKIQRERRKTASASISAELKISKAFAARGAFCKYAFNGAVSSCSPSPTGALLESRAPSKDCVQNQMIKAMTVIRIRTASPFLTTTRCPVTAPASSSDAASCVSGELISKLFHSTQIEFSGSQIGHRLDAANLIWPRLPERWEVRFGKPCEAFLTRICAECVQHNQPFPFAFIRHGSDNKHLFGRAGNFLQLFLDLDMRHHFATNLAEAAHAVCDAHESV